VVEAFLGPQCQKIEFILANNLFKRFEFIIRFKFASHVFYGKIAKLFLTFFLSANKSTKEKFYRPLLSLYLLLHIFKKKVFNKAFINLKKLTEINASSPSMLLLWENVFYLQ
jgi:hypothetical protein